MFKFFVIAIYKPLYQILRFVFYKILVKSYFWYLRLTKQLGLNGIHSKFSIVLNQKLVHFLVIIMTILLVVINLSVKNEANASGLTDQAHHTILAKLVISEIGGFEVDEPLIIENFDSQAIVSSAQQSYIDNLAIHPQAKTTFDDETLDKNIPYVPNLNNSIVRPNILATTITKQPRTKTVDYTVQNGDTISVIAEKFGISVSTILWENNLSAYSIIRPGDTLAILPMSGIMHKVVKNETLAGIAKKYQIEENKILTVNKLAKANSLKIGQKLLIPGGVKKTYRAPVPKTYTGFTAIKQIVSTPVAKNVSGNKMAWPTVGHRITQYYSWRHHGLDIANKIGTPLFAADSGVVEYAKRSRGYGYNILINHGGGKQTRYAHMSRFYVKKGDKVTKGMTIGEMGSTGWSTGPHIHFEVLINGKRYNPLNYIK